MLLRYVGGMPGKRKDRTDLVIADFLDYYFDLLNYVHQRELRHQRFDAECPPPDTPSVEYETAKHKYLGRERANLRRRRTRLRQGDFQILTQVGQGGYGQVFLASKKDTKEVCALKVMSKKLLFKLDEIRHILTERDILTAANSEWLVKLLYAFQDDMSIYLAMVCYCADLVRSVVLTFTRNMYLEGTSVHFSTILASSITAMPASTLPRCSAASMPFTSLAIFTEILSRKISSSTPSAT